MNMPLSSLKIFRPHNFQKNLFFKNPLNRGMAANDLWLYAVKVKNNVISNSSFATLTYNSFSG